jgi:hypothetical protein
VLSDNSELITLRLEIARERDRADAFQKAMTTEVLKVMRASVIQATIDADEEIARLKARVKELEDARPIGTASKADVEQEYYGYYPNPKDMMGVTKPDLRMDDFIHRVTYTGRLSVYAILTPGSKYRVRVENNYAVGRSMSGGTVFGVQLDGPAEDGNEIIMTLEEITTDSSLYGRDSITFNIP